MKYEVQGTDGSYYLVGKAELEVKLSHRQVMAALTPGDARGAEAGSIDLLSLESTLG